MFLKSERPLLLIYIYIYVEDSVIYSCRESEKNLLEEIKEFISYGCEIEETIEVRS